MDDSVTWNYDKPVYDQQRGRWYYEGRRSDGSRVRKYPPVDDGQAAQHDPRTSYQVTPRNDASALAAGMQAMSIQPVGSYEGDSQHYTTVQPGGSSPAAPSQGQTWSERRPSVYGTAGPTTTAAPAVGAQQVGPDLYSQSPDTSPQGTRADAHYQDSHTQRTYESESSGGPGHQQQYDGVMREQSAPSYPGPGTSPYDQQTAPRNNFYGALGGNQLYGDGYSVSSSTLMDSTFTDTRAQDRSRKHKHGSKAKGKGRAEADPYGGGGGGGGEVHKAITTKTIPTMVPAAGNHGTGSYAGQGGYGGQGGQAPIQASRFGTSPTGTAPRSFPDISVDATVGSTDGDLQSLTRGMYEQGGGGGGPSAGYRGSTYQTAAGDDLASPKSHSKSTKSDVIRGIPANSEYLDGRYRVEPSMRFEPGNVFKVMWSEPKGGTIPGGGSRFSDTLLQDHMSGVWTGFRRFIVIRNGEGHCSCVPILTYGKLGCLKNGVKPHHHGIVFEKGQQPVRLPNEPVLRFEPICMEMNPGEHISEESRVNYSKLVTVEHNVKVLFVGRILYDDWPIVQQAVDDCWDAKKSHPGGTGTSGHGHSHRSGHRKRSKGS
ncbi:hypothetical protein INS49_015253 [Diaporthe citri]|uniref:uncharacterized protein n=1 Tax=Diaporthe citri TaxID=83186 RepID=UPI001C7E7398|nr:uncharacterized protein INS49_015253 [Diaporthe citri]KAG6355869.1 hypothetical protein INS49_015253 [Diaporthe citri]